MWRLLKVKNIVLGVTGGIAAYKAPDIVSRLVKQGADVKVIMTEAAEKFVAPLTFQTMSQNFVVTDMFGDIPSWDVEHISIAKAADLFLIAPATANIIGKIANGIADDMLSTTVMATLAPVVFAPAMNTNMYNNPIFKENVSKLSELGYYFISPASGRLACGDVGEGKLEDPQRIVDFVLSLLSGEKNSNKSIYLNQSEEQSNGEANDSNVEMSRIPVELRDTDMSGMKLLVTAGPTIARLDPVRYITNNSSGKMGYEIAKAARDRGADVILVTGPTRLEKPSGIEVVEIETTDEMLNAIDEVFDSLDIVIKAAAPLDYKPMNYSNQKIKKADDNLSLEFQRTVDIAKALGEKKKDQILVGFAAESENLVENAKKKIVSKNLDFIVANDISGKETGFGSDYNAAEIIFNDGRIYEINKMTKRELADIIIDKVMEIKRA